MRPSQQRPKGRAVPPPPSPPPHQALPDADDAEVNDLVTLRFDPPLTREAFLTFAARHGLVHRPTGNEPQLYATADDVEVAYGYACCKPLPDAVSELIICGGSAPRPLAVAALVRAMLDTWPHAR